MLLQCCNVIMKFGGLTAINNVNIDVTEGKITGLIGPNGSGKTTLFNIISGLYKPTSGQVIFDEQNIAGKKPDFINKLGIARTFQNIRLFKEMTVWENVLVGRHSRFSQTIWDDLFATKRKITQEKEAIKYLAKLLDMFNLTEVAYEEASSLPYGLQRELEIVRALASEPKLLLLDEPAAGLNPQETNNLMKLVKKIRDMGIAILIVEHDMKLVMNICDRIIVLNNGKLIAQGAPQEIQKNEEVITAYLGRQVKQGA